MAPKTASLRKRGRPRERERDPDRRRITPRELLDLVMRCPLVIVYAGPTPPTDPDLVLVGFANGMANGMAAQVAWVDLTLEIDGETAFWILLQKINLGHRNSELAPGYYLFVDGVARAYETGLIDFRRDHTSLAAGTAAALVSLAFESPRLMRAALVAARAEAAARVVLTFMSVLVPDAPPEVPPPPPAPPIDELAVAFETFGIAATATHAEDKARYRALAKVWHPDRFTGDPAKEAEATVQMMQINGAYAAICAARGW